MSIAGDWLVFLTGCAGGLIAEILHWWNLRTADRLPEYSRSFFYWAITLAMVLVGGFVCWLQFGGNAEPMTALQIGLAAPIVLQKIVAGTQPVGARGAGASVRDFFRW